MPLDIDALSTADLAWFTARRRWHQQANHGNRKGKQLPPRPADLGRDYNILLWLAGRGFGKSKALHEVGWNEAWRCPGVIGHVVAPTYSDLKTVSFEGPSGLLNCIPTECLKGATREVAYNKSDHTITLSQGSVFKGFSATQDGDKLRGPQSHFSLGDEIAKWDKPRGNLKSAFHNLALGTRLPYPDGTPSRIYLGGTPRAIPFLKELMARPDVLVVRGTTYENLANLSANFVAEVLTLQGTPLGKQEILGELIDLEEIGIFHRSWFRLWPGDRELPEFSFIVISYDTGYEDENYDPDGGEAGEGKRDPTACTVWGVFNLAEAFPEEHKRLKATQNLPKYGILLCDAWSEMIELPDLVEKGVKWAKIRWGRAPGRKADINLIENTGSGRGLRQYMQNMRFPVVPFNPGRMSKTSRAHAVSPIVKQGMVFIPEAAAPERKGQPRSWCEPFLEQVCSYAGEGSVEHDDYLDSFSQTLMYMHATDHLRAIPPKEDPDVVRERMENEALLEKRRTESRRNPYAQ